MTVIIRDEFARLTAGELLSADPTPAPTNTPGNNWTVRNGGRIQGGSGGGTLAVENDFSSAPDQAGIDTGVVDMLVESQLMSWGSTPQGRIFARGDTSGQPANCYCFYTTAAGWAHSTDTWRIERRDAGTFSTLASGNYNANGPIVSGDILQLEVTGTGATVTITIRKNGTQIATYADSNANRKTSGGYAGYYSQFGALVWEYFKVDNLVGGGGGGHTVAIGEATETDSATAVTGAKAKSVGLASEADAAQPIGRGKFKAIGTASETDAAQPTGRSKAKALAAATETDAAQGLGRDKRKLVGQAAETDEAQTIATGGSTPVGTATETDAAQAVGKTKRKALAGAVETDAAQPVGRAKARAAGTALETDAAQPVGKAKRRALGFAGEADTALPVGRNSKPIAAALEFDLALPILATGPAVYVPDAPELPAPARAAELRAMQRAAELAARRI